MFHGSENERTVDYFCAVPIFLQFCPSILEFKNLFSAFILPFFIFLRCIADKTTH